MTQNLAQKLIDAIGPDDLIEILGWSERNVRHFRSTGKIAAHWYLPVKEIAESRGLHCPSAAFTFKSLANNNGGVSSSGTVGNSIPGMTP